MSFNISCPVCDTDNKHKHLNINLRKNTFRCPRCGDVQGGVLDLYALYADCSRGSAYKAISNSLGISPKKSSKPKRIEIKECALAPVIQRDKVYRALLSLLPLTQEHIRNLQNRGLDDEQIACFGFKSAIPEQMHDLGAVLYIRGYSLEGVPGFYVNAGTWSFRCDYAGILIPVMDLDGCIQGLQLRLDSKEKRKFRWISSGGMNQGTQAHSFPHFIGNQSDSIILTEGPMKGDIIHALSRMTVLAVPGVNCLSLLEPVLQELRLRGTIRVKTAFDMDFLSNPHVQNGYDQMCELLEKTGFSYRTYTWDPGYNGLDDYLKSICT